MLTRGLDVDAEEMTAGCNKWTTDRPSPLSHVPIVPPVRATRPRTPGVRVPAGALPRTDGFEPLIRR